MIGLVVAIQLFKPGALLLDSIELALLLFELVMAIQEIVDVEIEGIIGKLLVRFDDAGHGVGHGLIVRLHLEQQQDQRAQGLHPAFVRFAQGQHGVTHRVGVHQLTAVEHGFQFGRVVDQPGLFRELFQRLRQPGE